MLKEVGYLVDTVEKTSKFAKVKDLFGLFDVISLKFDHMILIQVTTSKPHPHNKYLKFVKEYGNEYLWIEQWVWIKYYGFNIYKYYPSGKKELKKVR